MAGHMVSLRRVVSAVVLVAAITLGVTVIVWAGGTGHKGGDPGGRLIASLSPLVRLVPGFETGPVPWISFPCDSCKWPSRYAIKIEPRWDSCDGIAGTFGWDPAVIQVGFRWSDSARDLVKLLNARLVAKDWKMGTPPSWGSAGPVTWEYPRGASPEETLALEPPIAGRPKSDEWMALLQARPVGPLVRGC